MRTEKCGWKNADDKTAACGKKNAHDNMRMENKPWKNTDDKMRKIKRVCQSLDGKMRMTMCGL